MAHDHSHPERPAAGPPQDMAPVIPKLASKKDAPRNSIRKRWANKVHRLRERILYTPVDVEGVGTFDSTDRAVQALLLLKAAADAARHVRALAPNHLNEIITADNRIIRLTYDELCRVVYAVAAQRSRVMLTARRVKDEMAGD